MKKYIIDFINELEVYKSLIKQLHWSSKNLPQHELCDDIAELISDYQDKIAEVEQSISGKFPLNILKGGNENVENLKSFVEKVISSTNDFYSKLKKEGDDYIGMRSDTEAFLSDMQRKLYLVDFTIKENLKQRLRSKMVENRVTVSNGKETYSLTENELRELVNEAIKNVTSNKNINEAVFDQKQFARHELDLYLETLKDFENKTMNVAGLMLQSGYKRAANFLGGLLRELRASHEYIEAGDIRNENDPVTENSIHIKPENKGKFTAAKKRTGKSTEELTHSKNPITKKRAIFAQNVKKWAK